MYTIYEIPGIKIGVSKDVEKRVKKQGFFNYNVLETHTCIYEVSARERELQKEYGYKVDHRLYKTLNPKTKMKINVTEQTTTFPVPIDRLKGRLHDVIGMEWETDHGRFKIDSDTIQWIMKNVKTSMYNPNRSYIYNKAFSVFASKPSVKCSKKPLKMFESIRSWAEERGIYAEGDSKTQLIKLQEEMGELAKATLENDKPEVIDAIGDMVVVLTNLAHLNGVHIETCIAEAYNVIAKRKGKMINGTFVKDEG